MSLMLTDVPDLLAELDRLLQQIPAGRVTTYGDLARALGDVTAARWVGEYLVDHPHGDDCPCHRVVRKGGGIGLYITGDPAEKTVRLESEGVDVTNGAVPPGCLMYTEFRTAAPLAALKELQQRLHEDVDLSPLSGSVRTVAGVDVSYITPGFGAAAYVRVDASTHELIWSTTVTAPVAFPYIPGYLTFRELPLYIALFEEVRRQSQEADVTLVDGNGILHPRRAGIASACGVAVGTPTVGIGKKLLCGRVDLEDLAAREPRHVIHQNERVGFAITAGERNRPFFVSPGHRIDVDGCMDVVLRTLGNGRLPVPIALADRLSRDTAQELKADDAP